MGWGCEQSHVTRTRRLVVDWGRWIWGRWIWGRWIWGRWIWGRWIWGLDLGSVDLGSVDLGSDPNRGLTPLSPVVPLSCHSNKNGTREGPVSVEAFAPD